jgi:hypothetical protein
MLRTKPSAARLSAGAMGMACFCILGAAACTERSTSPSADNAAAAPEPREAPPAVQAPKLIPTVEPRLGRAELLDAARRAANAYAEGAPPAPGDLQMAGRQFTLRIPLGCDGSAGPEGPLSWSYDADEETVRLEAKPDVSFASPQAQAIAGDGFERVEGFWVPRPWSTSERCPTIRQGQATARPPSPPVIGLAQFFSAQDSRREQRAGRAYQAVEKMEPEEVPTTGAFNLVLSGRLKPLPDGSIVKCHSVSINVRPTCLISAEFDRVSFENPENGAIVATWHSG